MCIYRLLLRLYPASFRAEYGEEMCAVFASRRRGENAFVLWATAIYDVVTNAVRVHLDVLRQDLRVTLNGLRRAPAFSLTAVGVAALGMGATTAAFTLLNHVLIRPLPFPHAEQLVALYQKELTHGTPRTEATPPNFEDWRALNKTFSAMGAYVPTQIPINLSGQGEPVQLDGNMASVDLFAILEVHPAVGRGFTIEDERDGAPAVVLISNGLATTLFGGAAGAVGATVRLNHQPYVVIGVMPSGFTFPSRETDVWMPLRGMTPESWANRRNHILNVVARLRPGVPVHQSRLDMELIAQQLELAYPKDNAGVGVEVLPLRDVMSPQSRTLVIAVFAAALCLMLIACTNLANLLFARATARRHEFALRVAIGAGSERLIRQMLTESAVLAVAGSTLGMLLAVLAIPLLTILVPAALPIGATPEMDWRVLGFAALLTLATSIAFGVGPALRFSRHADYTTLRVRASAGGRSDRLRAALVVAEVVGTMVLLVSTGLLLKAMWRVQAVDPGFRTDGVLTMRTSLPVFIPHASRRDFYTRVLTETRALPGVSSAAYISFLPMTFGAGNLPLTVPGVTMAEELRAHTRFITPGYFKTLGIPLIEGRDVSDQDHPTAQPVAVISQLLARRIWPGQLAIGRQMTMVGIDWTIVGVVGDVAVRGPEQASLPQTYFPSDQLPPSLGFYAPKDLVVRASGDPAALAPVVRRIIHGVNPEQAISDVRLLEDLVASQAASRRAQLTVLATFAAIAFLLAAVGIYGLLSFTVTTRTQEVGIRLALGAARRDVLMMFVSQGVLLGAAGIVVAIPLAYAAARGMTSLLFGVQPGDPLIYAAAALLALLMTLTGSLRPALHAASVDPAITIRTE